MHFWRIRHLHSPLLVQASKVAAENVAAACAQAVQVATAGCNTQQQALICQTACQQLTQCCQQLQSITPLNLSYADPPSCPAQTGDVTNTSDAESIQRQVQGANEGRQASTTAVDIPSGEAMLPRLHPTEQVTQLLAQSGLVSAAAVAALSPGVLPAPQMKPMLDCLIRLAMGVSQNSIQQAAMTAAAALVNKWPAGVLALLHDCLLLHNPAFRSYCSDCCETVMISMSMILQTNIPRGTLFCDRQQVGHAVQCAWTVLGTI